MAMLPPAEQDEIDPTPLLERWPMTLTRVEDIAKERAAAR